MKEETWQLTLSAFLICVPRTISKQLMILIILKFLWESWTLLDIVVSLWEQERPHLTYLDPIVDKFQESLKFRVQDH